MAPASSSAWCRNGLGAEAFAAADHLGQETSLEVTGVVREDKRAPGGTRATITRLAVRAPSHRLSDHAEGTRPRFPARSAPSVGALRSVSMRSCGSATKSEAAARLFPRTRFHAVRFADPDADRCEGTTNLFEIDYFGERKAYLTQSGQLYAEAGALAFGKVYCFGPTFRAEKSKTRRHLTEFWMVEPEVAYFTLDEDMHWPRVSSPLSCARARHGAAS